MKLFTQFSGTFALVLALTGCHAQTTTSASQGLTKNTTLPEAVNQNHTVQTVDGAPTTENTVSYKRLVWDTDGGGDFHFTVEPATDGAERFIVKMVAANFRNRTDELEIDASAGVLFDSLKQVFSNQIKIHSPVTDPAALTGSWSILRLFDQSNTETTYPNPEVVAPGPQTLFAELRSYIENKLPQTATPTPSPTPTDDQSGPSQAAK